MEDFFITLSCMSAPHYRAKLAEMQEKHFPGEAKLTESQIHTISVHAVAEALVLDWRGIEDEEGNPLECTPENVYSLISDPLSEDLMNFIVRKSSNLTHYRTESTKKTVKN